MSTPKISIAMATYNGSKYLQEQLDSLAAQTLSPQELVVCDDGSNDATLKIVEQFTIRTSFPVKIYRNDTHLGYADNFLKAASLCEGDWIAFSDQDDVWMTDKLEYIFKRLQSHQRVALVLHNAFITNEKLSVTGQIYPGYGVEHLEKGMESSVWFAPPGFTQLFDSNLLKDKDFKNRPSDYQKFDVKLAHDKLIYMLAAAEGSILYLEKSLVYHRRHDTCATPKEKRSKRSLLRNISQWSKSYPLLYRQHYEIFRSYGDMLKEHGYGAAANKYYAYSQAFFKRARLYDVYGMKRIYFILCNMSLDDYRKIDRNSAWFYPLLKDILQSLMFRNR